MLANRVAHARRHRCDRTPVSGASSDVVWATEAAPAVSVEPEPGSAGCGDWRVNTDFGCMTCGQVRNDLRDRSAAIEAKYNACSSDDDCAHAVVGSLCDQTCGAAVNQLGAEAYMRDIAQLEQTYCKAQRAWSAECDIRRPTCQTNAAVCDTFAGRCVEIQASSTPCSRRTLYQCAIDQACIVASGQPFDAAGQCFSAQSEPTRCVDRGFECRDEPTPAVDGTGNCYFFGECFPSGLNGYRAAPADHPCSAALGKTCSN